MVENTPAKAGDLRDVGSIPGSGRSLEEGMATRSNSLAWRARTMLKASGLGYPPYGTLLVRLGKENEVRGQTAG